LKQSIHCATQQAQRDQPGPKVSVPEKEEGQFTVRVGGDQRKGDLIAHLTKVFRVTFVIFHQ